MDVDPVEQRTGYFRNIPLDHRRGAVALASRVAKISAGTRIHRRGKHETRRKIVGMRLASMALPAPGGPINKILCPPAHATSNARFAACWRCLPPTPPRARLLPEPPRISSRLRGPPTSRRVLLAPAARCHPATVRPETYTYPEFCRRIDPRSRQAQRHRKVESGAFLADVGRRKINGDSPPIRKLEAANS